MKGEIRRVFIFKKNYGVWITLVIRNTRSEKLRIRHFITAFSDIP